MAIQQISSIEALATIRAPILPLVVVRLEVAAEVVLPLVAPMA